MITLLGIVAGTAAVVAFYKHKTLSGVIKSAKAEIVYLEAFAEKLPAEGQAVIARLKAIF